MQTKTHYLPNADLCKLIFEYDKAVKQLGKTEADKHESFAKLWDAFRLLAQHLQPRYGRSRLVQPDDLVSQATTKMIKKLSRYKRNAFSYFASIAINEMRFMIKRETIEQSRRLRGHDAKLGIAGRRRQQRSNRDSETPLPPVVQSDSGP